MRLFVALVPPPAAVDELAGALADLPATAPALRWVRPEQWHLTLAFLGEVDDARRDELVRRLARVAGRHPPPTLSLAGGGRFGTRVLWTRVVGDRAGLRRLVDSVRAAARRSGLPTDPRTYRPHLTLARGAGPAVSLAPLLPYLEAFAGTGWAAHELYLVRSHLGAGPGGTARHETVASWTLTGRRGAQASPRSR